MSAKTTHTSNRLHTRLHTRAKHHYYRVMPNQKRHRILVWVAFLVVSGVVAAQLLYPLDRAVPLAWVDGAHVGWQQEHDVAARASERFQATTLALGVEGGETREYPLATAGAQLEADMMVRALGDYPLWQRYVPFSLLWPRQYSARDSISFAPSVLADFSEQVAGELGYAPEDARLQIKDGALEAHNDKPGRIVEAEGLASRIQEVAVASGETIALTVPSREVAPATTAASLQAVRQQAEQALAIPMTLRVADHSVAPDKAERASWLVLGETEAGVVELRLDRDKLAAYLAELDKTVGAPAGQTKVTLRDGQEVARVAGAEGRTIDTDAVVQRVQAHLLAGEGDDTIELPLRPTPPAVVYNESYTATQAGLRAYTADVARRYGVAVAIQQIGGNGWTAEARADVSMPSASTYKLYISWVLFDRMSRGEIGWDDPMLDTTVSGCFDRMTIASTNPCAEAWIGQFGRAGINNFLYARGISTGTTFTNQVAAHTTARDLRYFMVGLHNGSLVGGAQRDRLLQSLSTHGFRQGIPAGSQGKVQDKVGFLWDYTHDAAIVQHPRGTYVMVVMTKGQSYARIAAITREVERIMYP